MTPTLRSGGQVLVELRVDADAITPTATLSGLRETALRAAAKG